MRYLLLLLLVACSQERQAANKAAWLIAHDKLNKLCIDTYGQRADSIVVRDTTIRDTIQGEDIVIRDTLKCKDSIIYRSHTCPPNKTIYSTRIKDTTIYRDNPFLRASYDKLLRDKDEQAKKIQDQVIKLQDEKDKDDWWKIACLITWAVVAIYITIKIIKR